MHFPPITRWSIPLLALAAWIGVSLSATSARQLEPARWIGQSVREATGTLCATSDEIGRTTDGPILQVWSRDPEGEVIDLRGYEGRVVAVTIANTIDPTELSDWQSGHTPSARWQLVRDLPGQRLWIDRDHRQAWSLRWTSDTRGELAATASVFDLVRWPLAQSAANTERDQANLLPRSL
ncbi:MAG: hypothetical protein ABI743_03120 [bacterium]